MSAVFHCTYPPPTSYKRKLSTSVSSPSYPPLFRSGRRMSWIPSSSATAAASLIQRELDRREQLEGSLLAVCAGCKDMVLQVRRAL